MKTFYYKLHLIKQLSPSSMKNAIILTTLAAVAIVLGIVIINEPSFQPEPDIQLIQSADLSKMYSAD